ncbi:histidine phosphatase family protein [Pelomonas sp. APW6]|uniref:Histidine phosphatase family protein n=1 Tax=Roseateles subflavus TaxID=3053353 RepID=A0ABT7LHM6_9BURK|nr:histidine phosphatase family protein [Pelomonas sp. APW6]MDL5031675.1 histidine phosphatase family protein [Pelomonas sp. APW6]
MRGALTVWRHPRPVGVQGRCIGGRSDVPVHWRRAKRLARRIQAHARRHRLPHEIWTSPLQRCADVGRWLRRWGWIHHQRDDLREIDFGAWDGLRWADIPKAEIDAWVADFPGFSPSGGESLNALLARIDACGLPEGALVVSHGGWMLARRWLQQAPGQVPEARTWPSPPRYGAMDGDLRR